MQWDCQYFHLSYCLLHHVSFLHLHQDHRYHLQPQRLLLWSLPWERMIVSWSVISRVRLDLMRSHLLPQLHPHQRELFTYVFSVSLSPQVELFFPKLVSLQVLSPFFTTFLLGVLLQPISHFEHRFPFLASICETCLTRALPWIFARVFLPRIILALVFSTHRICPSTLFNSKSAWGYYSWNHSHRTCRSRGDRTWHLQIRSSHHCWRFGQVWQKLHANQTCSRWSSLFGTCLRLWGRAKFSPELCP